MRSVTGQPQEISYGINCHHLFSEINVWHCPSWGLVFVFKCCFGKFIQLEKNWEKPTVSYKEIEYSYCQN